MCAKSPNLNWRSLILQTSSIYSYIRMSELLREFEGRADQADVYKNHLGAEIDKRRRLARLVLQHLALRLDLSHSLRLPSFAGRMR